MINTFWQQNEMNTYKAPKTWQQVLSDESWLFYEFMCNKNKFAFTSTILGIGTMIFELLYTLHLKKF